MRSFTLATLVLLAASSAPAQTPEASPASEAIFTEEQKQVAQEALRELKAARPEDVVTSSFARIAAMLESTSPRVWKVYVRRQYAQAFSGLIVPWGLVCLIYGYMRLMRKAWRLKGADRNLPYFGSDAPTARGVHAFLTKGLPCFLGFVSAWWGLSRVSDAISMIINPETHAVRDLLKALLS